MGKWVKYGKQYSLRHILAVNSTLCSACTGLIWGAKTALSACERWRAQLHCRVTVSNVMHSWKQTVPPVLEAILLELNRVNKLSAGKRYPSETTWRVDDSVSDYVAMSCEANYILNMECCIGLWLWEDIQLSSKVSSVFWGRISFVAWRVENGRSAS